MSEQDITRASAFLRPTTNDPEAWKSYWKEQGQPWRTEPEIDEERQKELDKFRNIKLDWKQGIFPFKDIKLSRADVEWLLVTHEEGRGPVDWSDKSQRERKGLDLRNADLSQKDLRNLPLACMQGGLTESQWNDATEEQKNMAAVCVKEASLFDAQLQGANLRRAQLNGVDLNAAAFSDEIYGSALLADVRWGEINLDIVDWTTVKMLGDECVARQQKTTDGKMKDKTTQINELQAAVRANRQLAVVLRDQGMNEEADNFAYKAQMLQRKVLWQQQNLGRWLFSMLLALLSGYGYRIWRILAAYLVVVTLFAMAYYFLGLVNPPHLSPVQTFLESITAFHGRVFLEQFKPDTPQIWLTAFEAIAGLIIEGVFIAMLIQRFFGK